MSGSAEVFGPAEFAVYIEAFNRNDFDGYSRFYSPDVRMSLNGNIQLNGTQEVRAFYERAHRQLGQHIQVSSVLADRDALFANLTGEFVALEDCPAFSMGSLVRGDRLISSSLVHYQLQTGRIRAVTTARYRLETIRAGR
ncbi:MAG: hypothetical protein JWR80_1568 [Bradyrhizobium sp.]|nr:hypothetical protein [Bradyrhizobium sp.]